MTDIFKAIDKKMSSKQNEKSLDILAELSRYHMYTGHYFDKKQLQNDLRISNSEFTNIMTGDEPNLSKYNQIIEYMKNNIHSVKN